LLGGVLGRAGEVRSRGRRRRRSVLLYFDSLRFATRSRIRQIAVSGGAEGRMAWYWWEGLHELGELDVHLFEFSY